MFAYALDKFRSVFLKEKKLKLPVEFTSSKKKKKKKKNQKP